MFADLSKYDASVLLNQITKLELYEFKLSTYVLGRPPFPAPPLLAAPRARILIGNVSISIRTIVELSRTETKTVM